MQAISEQQSAANPWASFAALIGALAIVFAFAARAYLHNYRIPPQSVIGIYCCFILLLSFVIAPAHNYTRSRLQKFLTLPYSQCTLVLAWCLPYLIYAAATGDFRWVALSKLIGISAILLLLYWPIPVRNELEFCWQDACAGLVLILAVLSHGLRGVWNVPVNLDFMGRLFLITVGSWCWVLVRRLPGMGYDLSISGKVWKGAAVNFAGFAVISIPLGLLIRFTAWNPRWRGAIDFGLHYLEIFLFIAVLEEAFFRGFLQTLVSNSMRSALLGQAVISLIFGFFHLLHAPFPNWRYVALASIAGWFYGSAFRTGGLMASSLLHAAVDTVWRIWFSRN